MARRPHSERGGEGHLGGGAGEVRLQRVLAAAGVAARRACERMIEEGRVRVNGRVVKRLPVFVEPGRDRVEVDGRPIGVRQTPRRIYIMVNKPERVLSSSADEPGAGRRTVTELVQHPSAGRLFSVGRLEFATAGLVLLTNDGQLANRLTHPSFGIPKVYRALARGTLDVGAVERARGALVKEMRKADRREGRVIPARVGAEGMAGDGSRVDVAISGYEEGEGGGRTELSITLRDGRLGNLGAMLAAAGVQVRKLERVGLGPLELKGVARGGWRELERSEVAALRRACRLSGGIGKKPPKPGLAAVDNSSEHDREVEL